MVVDTFCGEYGPFARYVKLGVVHALRMPGMFSPLLTSMETLVSDSQHASQCMRNTRAMMHVMITNPRWQGKHSRLSRLMCNLQLYVSTKRPMEWSTPHSRKLANVDCERKLGILYMNYFTTSLAAEYIRVINSCNKCLETAFLMSRWRSGDFLNTLRPKQNGRHFINDIFNSFFFNENAWIPNNISLKFVPKGPINNNPALVQLMAWCRPGDKPLSEPMMARLPTHICVTRPQWVKCDQELQIGSVLQG